MKNMMEKLRQWVAATSIQFVLAPYLPSGLIWAALLLAYTDLMLVLLGQPAGYWMDRNRASSSLPFLEDLLSAGILPYLLVGFTYLVLLWMVLTVLTRSFALVVWMPFSFVHLTHTLFWAIGKSKLVDNVTWNQVLAVSINAISALILGIILVKLLLSPRQPAGDMAPRKGWIKPVALGAWVIVLSTAISISAIWPRGGWVPLHPEHTPGRRANSAVAYDPVRQKVVLFGGISDWLGSGFLYEKDTWEWDGNDWIEMKPKTIPPARIGHMMTYDEKHGVVVMFGGQDKSGSYMLADTWVWDGKDWMQMSPDNYPSGRRGGQLFYDHQLGKVILSGGHYYASPDKIITPLNDTWEWDGKNWQYVTSTLESLIITNPNVAYDPLRERTILFNYNQVMTWADGQWNEMDVSTKTPTRYGTWLAASLESGEMLLFGGVENSVQLNDTWIWNGDIWKELHPDLSPSPRDAHVMFYDPTRHSFILYGGVNPYALDEMWEFVLP